MIRFNCDYSEGCHPLILEALNNTNNEQTIGYGCDHYCKEACELIKKECGHEDIDVHFLVGGTQTNLTVIDSALRSYQGIVAADSAHINVHEPGTIEACGHKILTIPNTNGKICAEDVEKLCLEHLNNPAFEHTTQPKMVFISFSTELGSIYCKDELTKLYNICKKYNLYLYIDGARLGYGLTSDDSDLTLKDICDLCDVFYIGGTKVGALFGEAVVIKNNDLKTDFRYFIKQKGGMLAKGRLLGIQFKVLFTNNLYFEISKHANDMANYLRNELESLNFEFITPNKTNQIFIKMNDNLINKINDYFALEIEDKLDDNYHMVRICTSWATKIEDCHKLINFIRNNI